jgi:hypothetical protein
MAQGLQVTIFQLSQAVTQGRILVGQFLDEKNAKIG